MKTASIASIDPREWAHFSCASRFSMCAPRHAPRQKCAPRRDEAKPFAYTGAMEKSGARARNVGESGGACEIARVSAQSPATGGEQSLRATHRRSRGCDNKLRGARRRPALRVAHDL
jgi:hypothetical protein